MSVVMGFIFVSKSATTLMVPITASVTKATGSVTMAMLVKVLYHHNNIFFAWCTLAGDDTHRC